MKRGNNHKCVVYVRKPPYTLMGIPVREHVEKVLSPTRFKFSFQTLASNEVLI